MATAELKTKAEGEKATDWKAVAEKLMAQRDVLLSACEAYLEEARSAMNDPEEMSEEWRAADREVVRAVRLCKPLSLNEI